MLEPVTMYNVHTRFHTRWILLGSMQSINFSNDTIISPKSQRYFYLIPFGHPKEPRRIIRGPDKIIHFKTQPALIDTGLTQYI